MSVAQFRLSCAGVARLAGQGGEQVSGRVTSPAEARRLLDDRRCTACWSWRPGDVVLSGAANPVGPQVAQQVLTTAA
ncbi:hypothetical protein [Kribbella swartbergensis]